MTSVSAGHIILTPTEPVGSGRSQRESNPGPFHKESRALPTELPPPPPRMNQTGIACLAYSLSAKDTPVMIACGVFCLPFTESCSTHQQKPLSGQTIRPIRVFFTDVHRDFENLTENYIRHCDLSLSRLYCLAEGVVHVKVIGP